MYIEPTNQELEKQIKLLQNKITALTKLTYDTHTDLTNNLLLHFKILTANLTQIQGQLQDNAKLLNSSYEVLKAIILDNQDPLIYHELVKPSYGNKELYLYLKGYFDMLKTWYDTTDKNPFIN